MSVSYRVNWASCNFTYKPYLPHFCLILFIHVVKKFRKAWRGVL